MVGHMIEVAKHCGHPRLMCVWNSGVQAFECLEPAEAAARLAANPSQYLDRAGAPGRPALGPQFKLVFITALVGTLFFLSICIALTVWMGREIEVVNKVVEGLLTMAQVGFGAIVGLLGAKSL